MIKKLINFTNKSFNNYSGPDEEFREKNILFGYNGTGKSSLVKGLEQEFLKKDNNTIDNVRLYSTDFINKSLLLDPVNRRKIKGIKVVFGEKNIATEMEIRDLESKIVKQVELDKISKEIEELNNKIKTEISKILNEKKGTLRIPNKQSSYSVVDIIKSYEDDLLNALKVESDINIIEKTIGDDALDKKIISLENLDKLPTEWVDIINIEKLSDKQKETYDDIKIPNSMVIKWLSEGVDIHKEKDNCEFCGAPINYNEIKNRVETYTNNIKFEAETFYKQIYKIINEKFEKIKNAISKKTVYINQISELGKLFYELELKINKLNQFKEDIYYNSENITKLRKIEINELTKVLKDISIITLDINNTIDNLTISEKKKAEKLSTIVKGAVSIAISKATVIINGLKDIETKNKALNSYKKTNEEIKGKLIILKESKSATVDFKNLVNEILKDINITIEIAIEAKDYFLKTTLLDKKELTIDDISEGEKNILSLIFFYFEMFEDKQQTILKNDIKLIILDDPISSMDDSNRFYVLELVRNIIELDVEQVFILSHVWDDYCQLIYGKSVFSNGSKYASYEIRKDKESMIARNNSLGNPYKFMFKEIYELSLKSSLTTDCDYFHIPNTIRKVFEEFLFFKTNKNSLAQGSKKAEIESLFKITSTSDKTKLGTLLRVSNVLSHTNTKTNDDILVASKFLMKIIENNDKLHFDAMKQ